MLLLLAGCFAAARQVTKLAVVVPDKKKRISLERWA